MTSIRLGLKLLSEELSCVPFVELRTLVDLHRCLDFHETISKGVCASLPGWGISAEELDGIPVELALSIADLLSEEEFGVFVESGVVLDISWNVGRHRHASGVSGSLVQFVEVKLLS